MKRTSIDCDCCMKKNVDKWVKVNIPIRGFSPSEEKTFLTTYKCHLCLECANRFMNLYYEVAAEHNSSGFVSIAQPKGE